MKPGDIVEWQPQHARGLMRGTVSRVVSGTVYVTVKRTSRKGREIGSEVWFEPDEAHRLRIVANAESTK